MAGLLKAHFVNTIKKWKGVQREEAVGDGLRGDRTVQTVTG